MLTGGPSVEYFKAMVENPKNALIFVGYQGEGSLGKKIQSMSMRTNNHNNKTLPMQINGKTTALNVRMSIKTVEGYSGHSDRNQLIQFYKRIIPKPEKVITVHGDEKSCTSLGKTLAFKYHVENVTPRNLDSIRLR